MSQSNKRLRWPNRPLKNHRLSEPIPINVVFSLSMVGSDGMRSGPNSAEQYRAMALLCRQQAAIDPDKRWDLLARAENWEHLAARQPGDVEYPGRRLVEESSSQSVLVSKPQRPS